MPVYLLVTVNVERGKTDEFAQFWRRESLPEWEKHGAKHIVYLNGHGPNRTGLELAVVNVQRATQAKILMVHCCQAAYNVFRMLAMLGDKLF